MCLQETQPPQNDVLQPIQITGLRRFSILGTLCSTSSAAKPGRQHLWLERVNPPKICQQLLNQKGCCFPALLQLPLCRAAHVGQSSQLLLQGGKQMSADGAATREQIYLISH